MLVAGLWPLVYKPNLVYLVVLKLRFDIRTRRDVAHSTGTVQAQPHRDVVQLAQALRVRESAKPKTLVHSFC